MKIKKALIIGASGFVGTHLTNRLVNKNIEVIAFARHFASKGKAVRYIEADICEQKYIKKAVKSRPDVIILLAGISGAIYCDDHPNESFKVNVVAQKNIIDTILTHAPNAKVIFSSSRHEYGKPLYLPVDENHPLVPISTYGLHKSYISLYLQYLYRKYNLDMTILRTANLYGPHTKQGNNRYNIVNYFIDQVRNNQSLVVFGKGTQLRDYIYIDDFIDLIVRICNNKRSRGQIYNVGSGNGTSLAQVAQKITKFSNAPKINHKIWPKESKDVETGDYISNITKVTTYTGWVPKILLDDGIKKTFMYLRHTL